MLICCIHLHLPAIFLGPWLPFFSALSLSLTLLNCHPLCFCFLRQGTWIWMQILRSRQDYTELQGSRRLHSIRPSQPRTPETTLDRGSPHYMTMELYRSSDHLTVYKLPLLGSSALEDVGLMLFNFPLLNKDPCIAVSDYGRRSVYLCWQMAVLLLWANANYATLRVSFYTLEVKMLRINLCAYLHQFTIIYFPLLSLFLHFLLLCLF